MVSHPSTLLIFLFIHLIFFARNTTSSPIDTTPYTIPLSPTCTPLTFLLRATAHNTRFLHPPDPTSASSILSFLHASYSNSSGPLTNGTHLIRGVFSLHVTYCRPLSRPPGLAPRTLQLLVHGTTYNKTIWSVLGLGHDDYDYIQMATGRGYHVLAVDLLGHGDSWNQNQKYDMDDGVTVIQPPLQTAALHSLVRLLRHGPINAPRKGWRNPLPYRFPRIVCVGHGYGSELGVYLARRYSKDLLDAVVHTSPVERGQFNTSVVKNLVPARLVDQDPERFGHNRNLPPLTYLTFGNAAQRERAFYGGFFEAGTIPVEDFRGQGTMTVGEAVYLATMDSKEDEVGVAKGYKGPVMLVAGERDALFCGGSGDGNVEKESCKQKLVEMGKRVWPDARKVGVYVGSETGHTWMMHYSAKITMWRIHNWLDGVFRRKMKDEEVMEGREHGKAGRLVVQDKSRDGYNKTDSDGECVVALDEVDGAQCL